MTVEFDFPFGIDPSGHTASTDPDDHVRDMIEQLLLTQPGERVNRPDFGSGLLQLVFAPNSPEIAAALELSVQAALQRWLGDVIEVQELDAESEDSTLRVTIRYMIKRTGEVRTDVIEEGAP
jgi:phage baseplate assembly protein W